MSLAKRISNVSSPSQHLHELQPVYEVKFAQKAADLGLRAADRRDGVRYLAPRSATRVLNIGRSTQIGSRKFIG
eukprot:6200579-Pleurochrysis_carterae.AAC.3